MIGPEFTSKSEVESNLSKTFSFSRTVQLLMGMCRINVKNGSASSPTVYQKAYTLVIAMFTIGLYYTMFAIYLNKYKVNKNLYRACELITSMHLLAYLMNLTHVRFINNSDNVDFFISMQKLDCCMDLDQNKCVNEVLRQINNLSTVLLLFFTITLVIIATVGATLPVIVTVSAFTFSELSIILEFNHITNLMVYYTCRIRFVNSIIANHSIRISKYESQDTLLYSKQLMRELAAKTHDLRYSDVDVYLHEIFKNFSKCQNLYQFQVIHISCILVRGLLKYAHRMYENFCISDVPVYLQIYNWECSISQYSSYRATTKCKICLPIFNEKAVFFCLLFLYLHPTWCK